MVPRHVKLGRRAVIAVLLDGHRQRVRSAQLSSPKVVCRRAHPLQERLVHLRPGLRRLRGPNRVPLARWGGGGVRAASARRASAARGLGEVVGRAARGNRAPGPAPARQRLGQTAPRRPTAPATARRSHRRAPTGPGLPRRGRAAARGPRRAAPGVAVSRRRPPRGRKGAAAGQNRARQRSGTNAPEEGPDALRPGLRRLRMPNRVP